MKCAVCNHPQALKINAALANAVPYAEVARQFSLSAYEIHAHLQALAIKASLATPLDAARRYLEAALASGHACQIVPATRLFLQCQAQLDRHVNPLTEENWLRNAKLRIIDRPALPYENGTGLDKPLCNPKRLPPLSHGQHR